MALMILLQSHLEVFNACLTELEKESIPAAEVKCVIHALLVKFENRKSSKFQTLQ
jgi:hypothetical protein